jgi:phosphohistidine phosphatase
MRKMQYEIYVLRHAHAGDPATWKGDDALRPLSQKGRAQAERLAEHLQRIGFRPDVVASSPKVRARQTAEIVAAAVGVDVQLDDRLAAGFDIERLREVVGALESGRVMVVGHDPDFSELVATLVGAPSIALPKGALARIDVDGQPAAGRGALRWFIPPDALMPADESKQPASGGARRSPAGRKSA